jgi:hypothetical protein
LLCTEIFSDIQNNFCTQHVLPMFCKKKSFWKRFTCIMELNPSFFCNFKFSFDAKNLWIRLVKPPSPWDKNQRTCRGLSAFKIGGGSSGRCVTVGRPPVLDLEANAAAYGGFDYVVREHRTHSDSN